MSIEACASKWPDRYTLMVEALANKIRRSIFSILQERPNLSFNQLMKNLKIDRASLAYHLGLLLKADLINNFYDKREGVKDHSFYEISAFGKTLAEMLFNKIDRQMELERYNTINFRNVESYTVEPEPAKKVAHKDYKIVKKQKQPEDVDEEPSQIVVVKGDRSTTITEWGTRILEGEEYKKLYSNNFFMIDED